MRWGTIVSLWISLQWRHNGCDSISNHQPHDCLLNRLFRLRSKKTSKLRVTGHLCGEFTGDRWVPCTNGQLRRKCFNLMTSSCLEQSDNSNTISHGFEISRGLVIRRRRRLAKIHTEVLYGFFSSYKLMLTWKLIRCCELLANISHGCLEWGWSSDSDIISMAWKPPWNASKKNFPYCGSVCWILIKFLGTESQ